MFQIKKPVEKRIKELKLQADHTEVKSFMNRAWGKFFEEKEFIEELEDDLEVIASKLKLLYDSAFSHKQAIALWDVYSDAMIVMNKIRTKLGKEVVDY